MLRSITSRTRRTIARKTQDVGVDSVSSKPQRSSQMSSMRMRRRRRRKGEEEEAVTMMISVAMTMTPTSNLTSN